jgi:hypothetical protein
MGHRKDISGNLHDYNGLQGFLKTSGTADSTNVTAVIFGNNRREPDRYLRPWPQDLTIERTCRSNPMPETRISLLRNRAKLSIL